MGYKGDFTIPTDGKADFSTSTFIPYASLRALPAMIASFIPPVNLF
jgi:hypothetical protein